MVDLNPSLEQYDEEVHVFASKEVKPILVSAGGWCPLPSAFMALSLSPHFAMEVKRSCSPQDAILAKYRAQFDSGSAIAGDVNFEHFTDKVMAFLTSQDYSLVLVPAFEHSIYDTTAVMAGIVSPSDTSRALLPNMESFQVLTCPIP